MANTKIQIKRSTVTSAPTTLDVGELAYSYSSNTLYIGNTFGTGVLAIGGLSTGIGSNAYANIVGAAGNNYASILAANNAVGANNWANTVGTAGNNYTNAVGAAGNNYASILVANNAIGANAWANTLSTADKITANNYANTVGTAGNNYASILAANNAIGANGWANTVGVAGNNYTNSVGLAGNNFAISVGAASNNYSNATFVKLTAPSQTITGDLAITGNLVFLGNATTIISNNLIIGDSVIYLAANNYSGTDIVDIGFVANYANGTGANVHTGLLRDHVTKQYYLFQGLDIELQANNQAFTPGANGAVNATLNADIVSNQITLGGINVQPWVTAAFTVANSSNGWANTVGVAGNNYTNSVGVAGNNYTNSVGLAGNNYTNTVGTAGNNYASILIANNAIGANGWANTLSTADRITANNYANTVGAAGNNYTNTVGTAGNNYASILVANNAVGANAWSNTKTANVFGTSGRVTAAYTTTGGLNNVTIDLATSGVTAATYGGNGLIPIFTVDSYGRLTVASNSSINVSAFSTGVLPVANGGTGAQTFTTNGVLIGNGTSPVTALYSSTEGHVLQVSSAGAPQYAMLDGGSF